MFRRIALILVLSAFTQHVFCNDSVNELRRSIRAAPDSARAAILVSIARLYQSENVDSCMYYAERATETAYLTHQYRALIDSETILSQIALQRRNYLRATGHQRTILEMATRLRNWDLVMEGNVAIARTWMLRGNFAEAVEFLKDGLEIAKDRSNLDFQKIFCQALVDAYRSLRLINNVIEYYAMLLEVSLAIDAEVFNNQITALQNELDIFTSESLEKLEQQQSRSSKILAIINILWAILVTAALLAFYLWFKYKYKPDIVKKQKEIGIVVNEYDSIRHSQKRIFQFLNDHTNKNIDSLSKKIKDFIVKHNKIPAKAVNNLKIINNEIFSVFGFLKDFMILSQIRSEFYKLELTSVNIPQLANNLFMDYEALAAEKKIRLTNEIHNNTLAIADEKLINIVIRNLISIAFSYSKEGKGRITVGTKIGSKRIVDNIYFEDAGFIEFWVTCDGFGLTPEQKTKMFELINKFSLPKEPEIKGYEVGLAVCKAVIEALSGNIWAETIHGEDLCIKFNLPKSKESEVRTKSLVENTQETISAEILPGGQLLLPE